MIWFAAASVLLSNPEYVNSRSRSRYKHHTPIGPHTASPFVFYDYLLILLARLAVQRIEMSRGLLISCFCVSPEQERRADGAHDLRGARRLGSGCDLMVPVNEYLVHYAEDVACFAL